MCLFLCCLITAIAIASEGAPSTEEVEPKANIEPSVEKEPSAKEKPPADATTTTKSALKQTENDFTKNDPTKKGIDDLLNLVAAHKKSLDLAIENHRSAIDQKENEVGPYDIELSEMVFGLGKTLQTSHRYDEAVAAYKRSLHLKRVNNGVYSLSQAPMLRGIIQSHLKQGQTHDAAEAYGQLIWIHMKTYGDNDPRLIPLLDEVSQWHLKSYIQTGDREDVEHLNAAYALYSTAIKLSSQHHGPNNLELVDLLKNLAIASYYQTLHQQRYPEYAELGTSVPFGYRPLGTSGDERLRRGSYFLQGHAAHKKILDILANNPDVTPTDKAKAHTDLGDWHQLYGNYQLAISAYQQAHKVMEGNEQQEQVLSTLFGVPTMLPELETEITADRASLTTESKVRANEDPVLEKTTPESTAPKSTAQKDTSNKNTANLKETPQPAVNFTALADTILFTQNSYVNLSVDVSEKGSATNMKIEAVYPKEASEYGQRAKRTIRAKKFRPRFESGQPVLTNAFPIKVLIPNENS
jgi:tetratricopeptide (TPR) repeat protein